LAQIILILQCTKTLENFAQHLRGDDVMSDVIKMPFTDKERHLTKAFQKEIT